ncbi:MAG TPA: hypothetical protein PKA90_14845 [Ignavibacteria bacterium]|nr:hypothetical protein [Ignavibacteria bacterium]HMR41694.1 hypothetical protein [Ignavibacteria bacterium]
MQKSTFLEIMRTLNKEELKRFESFLSSPYFNTRTNTIKLFSIIKKYAPDFDNKLLEKEEVWKILFPGKDYNYGLFKNIIYDITKLTERFLEIENFNSDEIGRMKHLLKELSGKNLKNIFLNKYNIIEKTFFKSSKFYHNYYEDYFDIKYCRFELEAFNPKDRTKLLASENAELMIINFMAKFSNNFNNIYIEKTEYNEKTGNDLIDLFAAAVFSNENLDSYIEELSKGDNKNYKTAVIFFKLMKSYLNPQDIKYYFEFRDTLFKNDKYISEAAMRGLYANLGSALDNCKDVSVNKNLELYYIFEHLVEKKIFAQEDGKVIPTLYLMTVKTAGYLKKPELISKLLKDYLSKTDIELQENFKNYSLAYLHYSKNEFDPALEYSNKITIDTFQLKYILKNLQIIISYEKNDFEMFLYLMDSQKHFLAKNKSVSESYKKSNMKFLNYTNSIFKLRDKYNKTEIGITDKLIKDDVVVNKQWLLEKLKDLKK